MAKRKKAKVARFRKADRDNAVLTLEGGGFAYRRQPCGGCPFRVDQIGQFPAEAFRLSAGTAEDGAMSTFACHESGHPYPQTCAGFILRNADNNMRIRLAEATGQLDRSEVHDGGCELHESYRAMAVANGVPADDPAIAKCRGNNDEYDFQR